MPGTIGNQKLFATYFAGYTGLSLPVVEAWLLNEQPPGSPSKPGSNNWLNIGFTDSGPNSEYGDIETLSPQRAAKASAEWAEKNQPSILASKGKSFLAQAESIVNSNWASSHYGGSASKFLGVGGASDVSLEGDLEKIPGVEPLAEGLKAAGENDPLAEGLEKGLEDGPKAFEEAKGAFSDAEDIGKLAVQVTYFLEVKNMVRFLEGLVGGILVLSALKTLGKSYGPSRVVISQTSQGQALAVRGARSAKRTAKKTNSKESPTKPKAKLKAKAPTTTTTTTVSAPAPKPGRGAGTKAAAATVKAAAEG